MVRRESKFVAYLHSLSDAQRRAEIVRLVKQFLVAKTASSFLDDLRKKLSDVLADHAGFSPHPRMIISDQHSKYVIRGFEQYRVRVVFEKLEDLLGAEAAAALLITPTISSLKAKARKKELFDKKGHLVTENMLDRIVNRTELPDYELRIDFSSRQKETDAQFVDIDEVVAEE